MFPRTTSGQLAWTRPIVAGRLAKSGWTLHDSWTTTGPARRLRELGDGEQDGRVLAGLHRETRLGNDQ
jgi:hypothetical protein